MEVLVKTDNENERNELRRAIAAAQKRAEAAEGFVRSVNALRDAAVAEEREACARLCEYAATTDRAIASGWRDEATPSSDRLLAVARLIRARAPQEPPQRPEAPRDGATPAPAAPPPAGGLPVAAAGVCPACRGRGRVLYAREVEDGCDECEATGRVPAGDTLLAATEHAGGHAAAAELRAAIGEDRCGPCVICARLAATATKE